MNMCLLHDCWVFYMGSSCPICSELCSEPVGPLPPDIELKKMKKFRVLLEFEMTKREQLKTLIEQ